ncbi:hypothetical protein PR202_gb21393 [Eleusine coracana subsp. coracana]|uniref:Uncharacterized protein n=1 Tax=Eleusine coracana subsp. coracana TaxID=191504 RepID=A0AAV5FD53_ELECO|nr:hypothetical protein PR202_gb21393 [Eleusine coracana subsp. coracana]
MAPTRCRWLTAALAARALAGQRPLPLRVLWCSGVETEARAVERAPDRGGATAGEGQGRELLRRAWCGRAGRVAALRHSAQLLRLPNPKIRPPNQSSAKISPSSEVELADKVTVCVCVSPKLTDDLALPYIITLSSESTTTVRIDRRRWRVASRGQSGYPNLRPHGSPRLPSPIPRPPLAPRFLAAPTVRSRLPPRVLSPSPSASPLLSSAPARLSSSWPGSCNFARERRRDTSRACSQADAAGPVQAVPLSKTLANLKDSCWRFLRPHTIRGTALGSIALVARALIENPELINWMLVFKAFYGLVALICGNGYIVGINQIYDIAIDKYVRGFLLNFGVYYATRAALGLTFQWSSPVAFITCFVTLFALVIAITKDLPDVEGDRKYQISTLATKLGVRNIAFLGSGLLVANYIAAIIVAFQMPQAFRCPVMVPVHAILAAGLIFQTWVLEQAKYTKLPSSVLQDAISQYYRFIWNLFYAEYIFFPII